MIVKFMKSKNVEINFERCHISHFVEVIRMPLSAEKRAEITGKYIHQLLHSLGIIILYS